MSVFKPTKVELLEAFGKSIPDIIKKNLDILFCGINPGLYSGATGRHFARPGNRFWKALFESGLTRTQLSPFEGEQLLKVNLGITNLVNRTTARADEIRQSEFRIGAKELEEKVKKHQPKIIAVLGIGAYRTGFDRPKFKIGLQNEKIGNSLVWVLPNPSGLNAHFHSSDFAKSFKEIRDFVSKLST